MQKTSVEVILPAAGIRVEFLVPATMTVRKASRLMLTALAEEYGLSLPETANPLLFDPVQQSILPQACTLSEAQVHHGSQLYLL